MRARVLGLRLLKLDATVVLVPADVTDGSSTPVNGRRRAFLPAAGRTGPGLAEALRSLDQGAELLAEVQRPRRHTNRRSSPARNASEGRRKSSAASRIPSPTS